MQSFIKVVLLLVVFGMLATITGCKDVLGAAMITIIVGIVGWAET